MKTIRISALSLFAYTTALFWPGTAEAQLKIDCKSVSERVKTAIEAKPDQVLTVVEDALVAYSGCVDSIVKTAIETTKADAAGVKQIVLVAVTTAEKDAPQIAESAVAAAPDHADAVREAFAEAFEGKAEAEADSKTAVAAAKPAVEKSSEVSGESTDKLTELRKDSQNETTSHAAHETTREAPTSSTPADTSEGKAVIGEVDYGGKEMVLNSGKGVVGDGETSVLYDNGVNYLSEGGQGALGGGVGGNSPGQSSRSDSFSYGPVDLAGVYLVPPVATAPPVVEEPEVIFKTEFRTQTRTRRVIRSVPMSPTNP